MERISVQQAAEKWQLSVRSVQNLCRQGKVQGAERFGTNWMIPANAPRPADGRSKVARSSPEEMYPMPRQSPVLAMTDLYYAPGCGPKAARALHSNPSAEKLFRAQLAYSQGRVEEAILDAREVLQIHRGFFATLGASLLLSLCAIWKGDLDLWYDMRNRLSHVPCRNSMERKLLELTFAAADSSIYDSYSMPEWFERGSFEGLPADSHPMAKVFYGKLLYVAAVGLASRQYEVEGMQGMSLMGIVHNTLEPMISQAVVDRTVIAEIHLRLLCAVTYYYSGRQTLAEQHADKAIALALPDRLYGILAVYWRMFDAFLEGRLGLAEPEAVRRVKELSRQFGGGHAALSSNIRNRAVTANLTTRERQIAKLVTFGRTNKKIAQQLQISESTVKTTVQNIMQKTGLTARGDFYRIL